MHKEPALLIGSLLGAIYAIIQFAQDDPTQAAIALGAALLQAFLTRQQVVAPATSDARETEAFLKGRGELPLQ